MRKVGVNQNNTRFLPTNMGFASQNIGDFKKSDTRKPCGCRKSWSWRLEARVSTHDLNTSIWHRTWYYWPIQKVPCLSPLGIPLPLKATAIWYLYLYICFFFAEYVTEKFGHLGIVTPCYPWTMITQIYLLLSVASILVVLPRNQVTRKCFRKTSPTSVVSRQNAQLPKERSIKHD